MKKLRKTVCTIAAAVCTFWSVHVKAADIVATAANQAGGIIALYDATCDKNGFVAVVIDPGGLVSLAGCAKALNDTQVIVTWSVGTTAIYQADGFTWVRPKHHNDKEM